MRWLVLYETVYFADGPDPLPKWRSMLDLNLIALSVLTRAAVQDMRSRGVNDGHIVHIGRYVVCVKNNCCLNF